MGHKRVIEGLRMINSVLLHLCSPSLPEGVKRKRSNYTTKVGGYVLEQRLESDMGVIEE